MKTRRASSVRKNTTKKNPYSWNALLKNKCRFPNKNNKKIKNKVKKIALEEAIIWPSQEKQVNEDVPLEYVLNTGKGYDKYNRLLDITDLRLKEMDENNVIYQIISPTASGIQNLNNKSNEYQIKKAVEINDYMHSKIRDHTNRFKAFCSLPMRSPKAAAKELERCVKNLGMLGALVNGNDNIYNNGSKNAEALYYDTPDYDVLWAMFEKLDVPLYIHPTIYPSVDVLQPDEALQAFYKKYSVLVASPWGFSMNLAQHMLRIIYSGVFDRFPKLKIILGHNGEFLPWWADRIDHRICIYKQELPLISKQAFKENNLPLFNVPKLSLMEYLRKNIYITTSGWFSDDALEYVIKKVGIDRVIFSIDYPYEKQNIACEWMDNVTFLSKEDKEKVAYKNAAKLLKLQV